MRGSRLDSLWCGCWRSPLRRACTACSGEKGGGKWNKLEERLEDQSFSTNPLPLSSSLPLPVLLLFLPLPLRPPPHPCFADVFACSSVPCALPTHLASDLTILTRGKCHAQSASLLRKSPSRLASNRSMHSSCIPYPPSGTYPLPMPSPPPLLLRCPPPPAPSSRTHS